MDIVKYPESILRKVAKPLEEIDDSVRERARGMLDLMYRDRGVGLAAPQVGWSTRLFVMNPTGDPKDERVFVNPVITARSKETTRSNEGCLSIPEVNGKIERAVNVRLEGYDLDGNEVNLDLAEFPARICQHEIDHLDGILIIDRMSPAEKSVAMPRLRDLEAAHAETHARPSRPRSYPS